MSSTEGGYKGFIFIIKNVAFEPTLFFPVNVKGKRERGPRFLLCFISHFGPAAKDDTNASNSLSRVVLST